MNSFYLNNSRVSKDFLRIFIIAKTSHFLTSVLPINPALAIKRNLDWHSARTIEDLARLQKVPSKFIVLIIPANCLSGVALSAFASGRRKLAQSPPAD